MNARTIIAGIILLVLFDLFIFRCSKKNTQKTTETCVETRTEASHLWSDDSSALFQAICPDLSCQPAFLSGAETKFASPIHATSLGVSPAAQAILIQSGECNSCNGRSRAALLYGTAL